MDGLRHGFGRLLVRVVAPLAEAVHAILRRAGAAHGFPSEGSFDAGDSAAHLARSSAIGALGEALVASRLREAGYPLLRNLVLEVGHGSAEIDVLTLTDDGLAVLEVKTWSGVVAPSSDPGVWLRHGSSCTVCVPDAVAQNRWHADALRRFLGDRRVAIRSYVVNAGTARFAPELDDVIFSPAAVVRALGPPPSTVSSPLARAWSRLTAEHACAPGRRSRHAARLSRVSGDAT